MKNAERMLKDLILTLKNKITASRSPNLGILKNMDIKTLYAKKPSPPKKEPVIRIIRGIDNKKPDPEIIHRASYIIRLYKDNYKDQFLIERRVMRETFGWDIELNGQFWDLKKLPSYANIKQKTPRDSRLQTSRRTKQIN